MDPIENSDVPNRGIIPAGWQGGFAQSNPAFAYPDPNLSSLPLLQNMDNIPLLERMQKAIWPEFSWKTIPDGPDDSSRCFQMFAPDISRVGYTDQGRVYSIICPQQGVWIPTLGCLNIEVSVTSQRGWVDEKAIEEIAADMTVEAKIWFSPGTYDKIVYQLVLDLCNKLKLPFPLSKANAILIALFSSDGAANPILPIRYGQSSTYTSPEFAIHEEAWSVANVEVEIGNVQPTGSAIVDEFNGMVMDVFNTGSGNLLQPGNILTWNVWVTAPELVDPMEWQNHAEKWRESIDADHGSPSGQGTTPRYRDGSSFSVADNIIAEKIQAIEAWLKQHLGISL